jgi:hypothetical protein
MLLTIFIIMLVGAFLLLYHVTLEINKLDTAVRSLTEIIRNHYERRTNTGAD